MTSTFFFAISSLKKKTKSTIHCTARPYPDDLLHHTHILPIRCTAHPHPRGSHLSEIVASGSSSSTHPGDLTSPDRGDEVSGDEASGD
jgi:hypothetical protein